MMLRMLLTIFCFSFAKIFRAGWGERRFSEYRPFSAVNSKDAVFSEILHFYFKFFNLRFLIFCDGKDCGEIIGEKNHHMVYN